VHANILAGILLSLQVTLLALLGPLALAGAMFAALFALSRMQNGVMVALS